MTDFYLAYHGSNNDNAVAISARLEKSNYNITYIPIMGEAGPYLSERLILLKRPIILLISDNFLKSTICMYDALSALRNLLKDELIYPVIVPGNYGTGSDNHQVPTKFAKVSHVLGYMSYWKDIYIDARKEKRPFLDPDKNSYNQKLQELKSIQSEVGEYIRQLRDIEHIRYEDIIASDFELLYKFLSKQRYVNVQAIDSTPGSSLVKDESPVLEKSIQDISVEDKSTEDKSKISQIIEHQAQTSPESQLSEADGFIEVKNIELDLRAGFDEEMISDKPLTDIVVPIQANNDSKVEAAKKKATIQNADNTEFDHTKEIIADSIEIFEAGQYEAGYLFLEDYLKYNPTNVDVRIHLANMRYDFGDKDVAADDMLYVLKLDDTNVLAHKWVAEYYEINNQPKKALHHLLRVQLLEPDSYEIDYRLGLLLKNHIKDFTSAKSYFESALKKNPNDNKSQFQLGLIKKEQGDLAGSKELLEKTLDSKNEIIESDYELTKVFMKAGDLDKVKHHWALAQANDPALNDERISAYIIESERIEQAQVDNTHNIGDIVSLPEIVLEPILPIEDFNEEIDINKDSEDIGFPEEPIENQDIENNEYIDIFDIEEPTDHFEDHETNKEIELTEEIEESRDKDVVEDQDINQESEDVEINEDLQPNEETESIESDDEIIMSDYELAKAALVTNDLEKVKLHWTLALADEPNLNDPRIATFLAKHKKKEKQKERLENIRKSVESDLSSKKPSSKKKKKSAKKKKKKSSTSKTILITGATAGIGKATALELAARGHRLILTGRRMDKLEQLSQEIKKGKVKLLNFDVRNYEAAKDAIASLSEEWANIDILINNAGLAQGKDPVHEADVEDWNTMIDTNVKGILHMTRLIAPSMASRNDGQIINVCSTAGHEVYPGGSVYCASKFAVRALTKGMRMDLHKYNIRVCQVSPGAVEETEFSKVRFHGDEEKAKIYGDYTPVNSRDIAKVIRFMITRPKRVNIEDVLVMSTQQASATIIDRSGRKNG